MKREDWPLWLTAKETAEMLQICEWSVYQMVKAGELPVFRVGRAIRINRDKLLEKGESA